MTVLGATPVPEIATAIGTIGTTIGLLVAGIRSWRKAPAEARLTEAEAKLREEQFWRDRVADLDVRLKHAQADLDSLRESKDEDRARFDRELRQSRERNDELEGRVDRLEAQVRELGHVPVA